MTQDNNHINPIKHHKLNLKSIKLLNI